VLRLLPAHGAERTGIGTIHGEGETKGGAPAPARPPRDGFVPRAALRGDPAYYRYVIGGGDLVAQPLHRLAFDGPGLVLACDVRARAANVIGVATHRLTLAQQRTIKPGHVAYHFEVRAGDLPPCLPAHLTLSTWAEIVAQLPIFCWPQAPGAAAFIDAVLGAHDRRPPGSYLVAYHGTSLGAGASLQAGRRASARLRPTPTSANPVLGTGVYMADFAKAARFAMYDSGLKRTLHPGRAGAIARVLVRHPGRPLRVKSIAPGSKTEREPMCCCARCHAHGSAPTQQRIRRAFDHRGLWRAHFDAVYLHPQKFVARAPEIAAKAECTVVASILAPTTCLFVGGDRDDTDNFVAAFPGARTFSVERSCAALSRAAALARDALHAPVAPAPRRSRKRQRHRRGAPVASPALAHAAHDQPTKCHAKPTARSGQVYNATIL
jgi:hypothetical protein